MFIEENVCLRGISETEPIKVLILKDKVVITEIDRRPINKPLWEENEMKYSCEYIKAISTKWYNIPLKKIPINPNDIVVRITFPKYIDNKKVEGMFTHYDYSIDTKKIQYVNMGNRHYVDVDFETIKNTLVNTQVSSDDEVKVIIIYPI